MHGGLPKNASKNCFGVRKSKEEGKTICGGSTAYFTLKKSQEKNKSEVVREMSRPSQKGSFKRRTIKVEKN